MERAASGLRSLALRLDHAFPDSGFAVDGNGVGAAHVGSITWDSRQRQRSRHCEASPSGEESERGESATHQLIRNSPHSTPFQGDKPGTSR